MTREEAIKLLIQYIDYDAETPDYYEMEKACKVALKVLKQEPCEDVISRKAVFEQINCWIGSGEYKYAMSERFLIDRIETLPPVNPQEPKTGHWEHGRELSRVFIGDALRGINYEDWHCSNCHCVVEQSIKPKWNYCPNCGAKMESEDKE